MFQPNQRMRFSVPQNDFNNRLPVPNNDCRIPNQMQQTTNPPRNFAPATQQRSVTVIGVGRQTVLGPPQDFPFMAAPAPPHFMGAPPPHIMGEPPPPFIPQQPQILGTPNSFRPPQNQPHHMPSPQLQQSNRFPHVPSVPMDMPYTNFQGPGAPRFIETPYRPNEFDAASSRQTIDYQHGLGNFSDRSDFMGPSFQPPNHDGMISNIAYRSHMDMFEPENNDIEDLIMAENETTADDRDFDEEPESSFDKYRREKDQFWVGKWLKKIGKLKPSAISSQRKSSDRQQRHKIHEVQQAFHQSIIFLAKLQHQCRSLESMATSVDPQIWEAEKNLTEEYKDKCIELHHYLDNDELLRQIKFKMESRKKKRARLKKQRKKSNEEVQAAKEHRENVHQQLEEWRTKMAQLAEDEKQKAELKKSADSTLSSVRKKISDAKRTQEFLKAIQKLRKIRRSAAINQGRYASDAYDLNFEKKMDELTKLMTKQQAVYEAEEKTLKVMLEAVEEETRERDKEIKRQKERAKERLEKKITREKLFGKNLDLSQDDELHPFNMYYRQAEHGMDALIQIRHEWDLHLVPPNIPGSSRIPDGYVVPGEPTSDVWATALK